MTKKKANIISTFVLLYIISMILEASIFGSLLLLAIFILGYVLFILYAIWLFVRDSLLGEIF